MRSVLEVARLQLLENVRRQVHLITLFMAFGILMLPAYVNAFSMGLQAFETVTKDFGLTLISYYGIAMSLLLGSSVVPRDIERKTIYPILSRPLPRISYLAGQFLGTAILLLASLMLLTTSLGLGIFSLSHFFDTGLFIAAFGYTLECWVLVAACQCFSTLASPPLAGVMGFFLWVIGGISSTFIDFFLREDREATDLARFVEILKGLFPNFNVFHLKYPVVHGFHVAPGFVGAITTYGLGWVALFVILAALRFEKRDL